MDDIGGALYTQFCGGGSEETEKSVFEQLVRRYRDGLVLFIYQYVRSIEDAEDAAQEVFFRLYVRKPHYSPRASFKTWLYTIGRNEALNLLKKRGKVLPPAETEEDRQAEDPASELIADEERRALHRALGELNGDYRSVLYLRFFEELDNAQIGALTGKREKQVRDLLCNAKKALRAVILNGGKKYEILRRDIEWNI